MPQPASRVLEFLAILACLLLPGAGFVSRARGAGLQPGDLVAVVGDSITQQCRYSVFIEDYLLMCQPVPEVEVMQMGWNGETSWGFLGRMKDDALPFSPTVVTTCFGMNDAGEGPLTPQRAKQYREGLQGVIRTFRNAGVRHVIVGSPGVVDPAVYKGDAARRNTALAGAAAIAKDVATEQGVEYAEVHQVMMDAMTRAKAKYGPQYRIGGNDGVHPSHNGHLVMAYAFLKALGCTGDIGTIHYDMPSRKATGSAGHEVLSVTGDTVTLESTRYPFCFFGKPDDIAGTTGIIECIPFNEDLNRYVLRVSHAPPQVDVTWGTTTKRFTAAAAAQGINLAAEFPVNPFSKPFADVDRVVQAQQAFEVPAVKGMIHSLADWRKGLPEEAEVFGRLEAQVVVRCRDLRSRSKAAVVPVRHVITISPVK